MNFPTNPTSGNTYTFNGRTWVWNGTGWAMKPDSITDIAGNLNIVGKVSASNGIFSNLSDGYVPYHQNDTNGLINSSIYISETNVGINYTSSSFNQNLIIGGSTSQSSIGLYSLYGSGAAEVRNWALKTNTGTNGSFSIQQSGIKDGNPSSGGIDRLFIDKDGNIVINGTDSLTSNSGSLFIKNNKALPNTVGILNTMLSLYNLNSNASYLDISTIRTSAGGIGDWETSGTRIHQRIDNTYMGYIQFNGTDNQGGISLGTGYHASVSNVPERIKIDSTGQVFINQSEGSIYSLNVTGSINTSNSYKLGNGWEFKNSGSNLEVLLNGVSKGGFTPNGFYSTGEVAAYASGVGAGLTLMGDMDANNYVIYAVKSLSAGDMMFGYVGAKMGLHEELTGTTIATFDENDYNYYFADNKLIYDNANNIFSVTGQVNATEFKFGNYSFKQSANGLSICFNGVEQAYITNTGQYVNS